MIDICSHETSEVMPRSAVTHRQRKEMFDLLCRYFTGVDQGQFDCDLAEKNWVICLRRGGRLVGFSTLLAMEAPLENASITAIYSGDTIVAPEAWRTPALARAWIEKVNLIRAE